MDEGLEPLRDLASATRELNRLVRTTRVEAATLDHARQLIDEASALLASATYDGPHAQTGLGEMGLVASSRPAEFFPYSPVTGPLNPISPPVELEMQDDGTVVGHAVLSEVWNGPPWNLAHGGTVALIMDELLGVTTMAGAGGGFTGRLTVRYHQPTPIGQPLALFGEVTEVRGRKIKARGTIHADGVLTAEAEGLFISAAGPLAEAGSSDG